MKAIWICLISMYVVAAIPLEDSKVQEMMRNDNPSLVESILLNLLEDLRHTIYNGSDDLPVLDPLHIEELTIDDQMVPLPGSHLHIKDTTIRNLGTFIVDELSVTVLLIVNNALVSAYIPVIDIDIGEYDLDVSAAGFNIFGAGGGSIKIINPRLTADLTLRIGLGGITVTDCDAKLTLGAFEPRLTGLFGHEGASDFVNLFLQDLVPELIKFYENEINAFLSVLVRDIVSNVLP